MAVLSYVTKGVIEAPQVEVFDFCSDLRNELVWNPNAEAVEKVTDGPVDAGTRFRARWVAAGDMFVEVVEFDRPKSWATRAVARGMEVLFRGTVAEDDDGTRYVTRMEVRPAGLAWLYAPLAWLAMRRQDATNMRLIKKALESREETRR
jgi:hypothetical protein